MQRVTEPSGDSDEAALLFVIGDWEEPSRHERVEGPLVPSFTMSLVFSPTCHVQVAADDVHRQVVAGAEVQRCVDCPAELQDARLRFFLHAHC